MKKVGVAFAALSCGALLASCGTTITASDPTTSTASASTTSDETATESSPGNSTTRDASPPSAPPKTTAITPGTVATCQPVSERDITALLEGWNNDVNSGDARKVVENYAPDSILVPIVSNRVRSTSDEKVDYFERFLANKPSGTVDYSDVDLGCNMAVDSGLYTFTYGTTGEKVQARYSFTYHYENGRWLIVNHHSSGMPELDKASTQTSSSSS